MTRMKMFEPDPVLDLVFERVIDVPRELVWKAWTTPELIKQWFTPAPWTTIDCEIDLRPGGIFRTIMRSPEGQEFPNVGSFLEVLPNERLTWTNALLPGFRPAIANSACPGETFSFTAVISLEPQGSGTKYTALVIHGDADGRKRHEAMGFHDGWGKALDQLVALVKR
ncbi:MAG: SRPBCC family protein [Casimicrobiaceae bacterium]